MLSQPKDAGLYPDYDAALQAGMVRDMRATWEGLAFDDKASALTLFSTPKATVNAELAKLYGLTRPASPPLLQDRFAARG